MELWTLGELTDRVGAALADYPGQVNGRVRAVPDQRAIRWYTTIGLIDRPTEMRGRTAFYSQRHLLQLVAIKRRQSEGHTLAEIQTELTGATNETLHPIAALPPTAAGGPAGDTAPPSPSAAGIPSAAAPSPAASGTSSTATAATTAAAAANPSAATPAPGSPGDPAPGSHVKPPPPSRPRFWADHPQQPPAADPAPTPTADQLAVVTAVRLADGITVVLDHPGPIADPARLAAAAAPLLAELTKQGLLNRSSGDET
ncbi:MerR family transcriptional regulator [Kribbella sp. NPDC056861]|uniref:MerR family transcriptional regulator n=1 Tax=Kribbella sp. NPDC056861 TaxID=3154857 RepID=UPI0034396459